VLSYLQLLDSLKATPRRWLVTGVAGFIGSHLLETLLGHGQWVVGIDNLSTGAQRNLDDVRDQLPAEAWGRFKLITGDIRSLPTCLAACQGVDFVLHQAALGSVPQSIALPIDSHDCNVTGFLNRLVAAKETAVRRIVYASSSAVYGDDPGLPKVEERLGRCLSPYAATKLADELYAQVFSRCYSLRTIGLRYFNVFGPRQDPEGAYAAVIPKWIASMIRNEAVYINGDGETSRDFCYVANVVQANLLAATTTNPEALDTEYNVAVHARTTLNELFELLRSRLRPHHPHLEKFSPVYREFRAGDVLHSEADISKARKLLGYKPTHQMAQGLDEALGWYRANVETLKR
jgi:UDP-N-acetylglucosamine 4-epimerase